MSACKATQFHIARLMLSVMLGSLCLLSLIVLLDRGAQAESASLAGPGGSESILAAPLIQANGAYTQYMPLVMRSYGALINGGFEQGLTGWVTEQGPFQASGTGLPVSAVALPTGHAVLLGLTNATNNEIPVGYGSLYQSFIVRERYLRFSYWVYSYDVAYSSGHYYDTFEVSINRPLAYVSDAERNTRGCSGAVLNPQGSLIVPANGLVFCAGQPGDAGGLLWDTGGWRTVTLDLNAYRGQWVTLAMAVWSREYDPLFAPDRAWYSTWAYVDDVHFTSSATAASAVDASADMPSPIVPSEARIARFPWDVEGVSPPR